MAVLLHRAEGRVGSVAICQSAHVQQRKIEIVDAAFRALLRDMLSPCAEVIRMSGHTVSALAELVQISASTAKQKARSRRHLLQLLETLKRMELVVTGVQVI